MNRFIKYILSWLLFLIFSLFIHYYNDITILKDVFINFTEISELKGKIHDSYCNFETVDKATHSFFFPILSNLQNRIFFHYFKINLDKECIIWDDGDGALVCNNPNCGVCLPDVDEIPSIFMDQNNCQDENNNNNNNNNNHINNNNNQKEMLELSTVTRINEKEKNQLEEWSEKNNDDVWIIQDENEEGMIYINLLDNPERYTGYSGPYSHKIWSSLYEENCFTILEETSKCYEKRIFFRLISGFHTSVTAHIAMKYQNALTLQWEPNIDLFIDRIGKYPDRLENLYFAYIFLLRAISKGKPLIDNINYDTGNEKDDKLTRKLIDDLLGKNINNIDTNIINECKKGFDESKMFQIPDSEFLTYDQYEIEYQSKEQLRTEMMLRFHNISRIMNCVSCEKCRLWGTLQVLGFGTALKILLYPNNVEELTLQRNEIVALINTAGQLSKSINSIENWRHEELIDNILTFNWYIFFLFTIIIIILLYKNYKYNKNINKNKNKKK